ncbi:MAG: hypothetical protein KAS04_00185, partial [Candidatus Aenigmarchaeota archaeon]|nr:hypothetical protein [Candidatus Aenigmarchaeota archaeon]
FINLCAFYWKKKCDMTLAHVIERFPDMDDLLYELTEEELVIINLINNVSIKFLDEQYKQFKKNPPKMKRMNIPASRDNTKPGCTKVPLHSDVTNDPNLNIPAFSRTRTLKNKNKNKKTKKVTKNKKTKRFVPPSIEQVTEYCKERNNTIDPILWWNSYKAKGWKISNNVTMKDWKAAVRTWEQNQKRYGYARPKNTVGSRQGKASRKQYRKPDIEA